MELRSRDAGHVDGDGVTARRPQGNVDSRARGNRSATNYSENRHTAPAARAILTAAIDGRTVINGTAAIRGSMEVRDRPPRTLTLGAALF